MSEFQFEFTVTGSGSFTDDSSTYDDFLYGGAVDPGFYLQSPGWSDVTDVTYDYTPDIAPVDGVVEEILGQLPPVMQEIDGTVEWVQSDPSLGWVGDVPATDPLLGDLAPVLGDTGTLGQIISGVITDPYAPLDPNDETWVGNETELNGYWNTVIGGVQDGQEMQQRAIDDLLRYNEQVQMHNRIYELLEFGPARWPNY